MSTSTITDSSSAAFTTPLSAKIESILATPAAHAKFRYIPSGKTPQSSSQPLAMPALSEFCDERQMPLYDLRPLPTLKENSSTQDVSEGLLLRGFTALDNPSVMHSLPYTDQSWYDSEVVEKIYTPETQDMLKRLTGAKVVIVEAMVLRNSSQRAKEDRLPQDTGNMQDDRKQEAFAASQSQQGFAKPGFPLLVGFSPIVGKRPAVPKVHLDWTPDGARVHLRNAHPIVKATCEPIFAAEDDLIAAGLPLDINYPIHHTAHRWAAYSVWRPLKTVRRDPLAMCDMEDVNREDLVTTEILVPSKSPDGMAKGTYTLKGYVGRWGKGHRWHFVSEQKREEVLIVRHWDSDRERDSITAGGVMHSSVELDGQNPDEPRESLELRCLAIW